MQEKIKYAQETAEQLLSQKPLAYSNLKNVVPETQGVYLVYEKYEQNRERIIYVGKGTNLERRILHNHIMGHAGSSFRNQLEKAYLFTSEEDKTNWIKSNCLFSWAEVKDRDLCQLVEALLIAHVRSGNLLNS